MNDRLFTLLGGAIALVLVAALLGLGPQQEPPKVSRPGSQDEGAAGLLGLYRWLDSGGIPVRRLRKRYTELPALAPGTGHLLVIAEPMVWPVRPSESGALHDWVASGNQVLVLSSAQLWSGWGLQSHEALAALQLRRGFLSLDGKDDDKQASPWREACSGDAITRGTITGPQRRLRPATNSWHPVLAGVREILVKTPAPRLGVYRPVEYDQKARRWLPLLCDPQLRVPVLTAFRVGDGRAWALDYGMTFGNDNLGRGDNARLFGNLVAFALGPRGSVVFDDMHQGDSELYDPDAFFSDPRLHGTLAFLFGMWLLWLLGHSSRLAPLTPAPARLTSRDFMLAVARFHARYLKSREAAGALYRQFFNIVRQRYRLPTTGEPAWDALKRAPGAADADLRQLREWHDRLQRGRDVPLPKLRNLILKVQESLK